MSKAKQRTKAGCFTYAIDSHFVSHSAARGIEYELLHHFQLHFLSGLLSPVWNQTQFLEYRDQVMDLFLTVASVKHAVLASSASNKYMLSRDSRYEKLALGYYSQAVKEVNAALQELCSEQTIPSNALLWGKDKHVNPSTHVAGAMALINARLNHNPSSLSITRAIDRVALESVIYQAFLLSTGRPLTPSFFIHPRCLSRIESLLEPAKSPQSSPILSLPLSLYRLIWDIVELCHDPTHTEERAIQHLALELARWENSVLQSNPTASPNPKSAESRHACFQTLYVIAASILFGWISGSLAVPLTMQFPVLARSVLPTRLPPWQMRHALSLLNQPEVVDPWAQSFLAAWPILIFGLAARSKGEAMLIRDVLVRMRDRMGYGFAQRTLGELEVEWRAKWKW
ncbi:hypothetical protein FE257_012847 [Aspergillus nanangensis]|uniref:Uncharacterized protein n=1 Tax=Aspergillus nanangensis TaxID=2582783 RepID=A0AAD4CFH7_ASPNN|nr:hypothetical protein FE257_012847 [Aspergillus nanangensis]